MLKEIFWSLAEFEEKFQLCIDMLSAFRQVFLVGTFMVINIELGGGVNERVAKNLF